MHVLTGAIQHYAWGDSQTLPAFTRKPRDAQPWAEVWFGAHPLGPTRLADGSTLAEYIAAAPAAALGEPVMRQFGAALPFLMKFIAPARPLSLQVHPSRVQARAGFAREEAAGLARTDPCRNYPDANHKPELVYALTRFEALSGFRAPRRAAEILSTLAAPLARELSALMRDAPGAAGLEAVCRRLLEPARRPSAREVRRTCDACAERLAAGASPSLRADRIAVELGRAYPGDAGAVLALILNPVTLEPGETLFTPSGSLHAYLRGLGVEVMADSDNVLRAGLTPKHVDAAEALRCIDFRGAPPVRIAPERLNEATRVFYAPVADFELSVTDVAGAGVRVPGRGPRILAVLDGEVRVRDEDEAADLRRGDAVFVPASAGPLRVDGRGCVAQVDVP